MSVLPPASFRVGAIAMASNDQQRVVEVERRQARVIAVTTGLGVVAAFAGLVIQSTGVDPKASDDAERLLDRADSYGSILGGAIVTGVGYLLLAGTILFLFTAIASRTEQVRPAYKPMVVIGAVLLAVSGVVSAIAYNSVASDFVDAGLPTSGEAAIDRARDLISGSTLLQVGAFAGLAGLAAFAFGVIYTSLWARRTGLLSRFWGTLGIAFGVAFLLTFMLQTPIGFFGVLLWLVHVALVANGRWMGGPLPAWEQGKAVPWPDPKAPPPDPEPEEPASPDDFEGAATEVTQSPRPARRDNKRKRKRKQRG